MKQAELGPTRHYLRFDTAERLGKSVRELLTGQAGPLTAMEDALWRRKRVADARLAQQRRGRGRLR